MVEPLLISVSQFNGTRLVAVAGEVDCATAPLLADELETLGSCKVTVDFSAVTFVDSSGLRCLVEARKRISGDGGSLTVQGASSLVRRTFEITGLDEVFFVDELPTVA